MHDRASRQSKGCEIRESIVRCGAKNRIVQKRCNIKGNRVPRGGWTVPNCNLRRVVDPISLAIITLSTRHRFCFLVCQRCKISSPEKPTAPVPKHGRVTAVGSPPTVPNGNPALFCPELFGKHPQYFYCPAVAPGLTNFSVIRSLSPIARYLALSVSPSLNDGGSVHTPLA